MLYAIVALLLLIADQGVKYWTTMHIALDTGKQSLIAGLIDLRNIHNSGSAFSFLGGWDGARWLFLAVTVVFAVLVILAIAKKVIRGGFGRWMALCVLAGALGNAIDRSLHGYVIDMFEFAFFPRFPVFNVADIYITVCGILFCIYILCGKEPLGAPDKAEMRPGPGGSMTRPAPKKEKQPRERMKLFAAKEETEAVPEVQEVRVEVKAEPKKAAEPKAKEKNVFSRMRRPAPEKSERDLKFEQLKRPVVTHESFLEATRRLPGDDPFAEWSISEAPVRTVEPEEPTVVLKTPESPAVPEAEEPTRVLPVVEEPERIIPAVEEPTVAFVPETKSAEEPAEAPAEKPAEAPAEKPAAENEEPVFDLEDILNEFRDL